MNIDQLKALLIFENSSFKILGSYQDKNLKYFSDIDFQDIVKFHTKDSSKNTLKYIYSFFLNIFRNSNKYKYIITDFKCGEISQSKYVLRWNYEDMLNKYVLYNNQKISFDSALATKSIIKIDLLSRVKENENLFTEISCNYYFYFTNTNTIPNLLYNNLAIVFYNEYLNYLNDENIFKALKRLYKFFQYVGDKKNINLIAKYLNSRIGQLSSVNSKLETIDMVLNKKYSKYFKIDDVKNDILKILDGNVNKSALTRVEVELSNKINISNLKNIIGQIVNMNKKVIDANAFKFLKEKIDMNDVLEYLSRV